VAKILVADDNSNIQKMVGLALKDHGIDVVAVGNGEAAVRKIADVRPDLVLADVFMPVRNGYEVCKYVKDDSSLSHIPVILLVGAFDPLDEQEAQRSGADGVLKKPFVPPDPLISMVKSALVRAGVAHAGFTPAKPVEEAPAAVAEVAPPQTASRKISLPTFSEPDPIDEAPTRPAEVKIDSDQQPVAFGSLLGTEEEADSTLTARPELERDWRTEEVEEEEDEEADAKPSWRRDGGDEEVGNDIPARQGGWRDSISDEQPVHAHASREHWTPTREKQDLDASAEAEEAPITSSPLPDFRNIPAAPFAGEAWAAAIEAGSPNKSAVAEADHPAIAEARTSELDALVGHAETSATEADQAPAIEEQSFVTEVPVSAPEPVVEAVEEKNQGPAVIDPEATQEIAREASPESQAFVSEAPKSTAASWFSTAPNPWDAELQKANKLASTWDTPVAAAPAVPETTPVAAVAAPDEIEVVSGAVASDVIPAAVETAREEAHSSQDVDMDAVVEKVMARMSPEKLHELTRDLLKPVIEGIVRDEINKKS
jgi:CheY-like chemotaxis protein